MTLRVKILIIVITTSLLLSSLINASSHFILVKSFSNLEEEYCIKNVQRTISIFNSEKNTLLITADDYAAWDDTYTFVENLNQEYIQSNLTPGTFTSLKIDFIVYADNSGRAITSYGYDLINNRSTPVDPALLDLVATNPFFHNPRENTESVGYILLKGEPLLLAYHPILTSLSLGPPRGSLIMGRYLSKDYSAHLSDATQSLVLVEPYAGSTLGLELQSALQVPAAEPIKFIKILNPQSIAGYTVINDIFGNPALILRSVMERDIFNQGYDTIIFFIYVVFFGSLFFFIAAVLMLDHHVIKRITEFSKSVSNLRINRTLVDRLPVKGKDEISSLGNEINEMLQTLEAAEEQLRRSHDELEKQVEARTEELVEVNLELKTEIAEHELGQRALFEAYNEIQLIHSSISSIMIGVDSDGMVTQWNDVAVTLLGLSSSEVIGLEFFTLPIIWDWDKIIQEAAECTRNNRKVRMDDILLGNPGDNPRVLGITLTPLFLRDKEQAGFLLVGADITERRLLEQQLGRSNKMEAIGELAAGVAHEINTPTQLVGSNLRFLGKQLEAVLGLIDKVYILNRAVKNGNATPELALATEKAAADVHLEYFRQEAPKAIEQSLEGIDRISRIVAAMRFFTHPGGQNKEMANLNLIIQNALSLSRNEWKNVAEIKIDLEEDLPSIECLPSELSQVVLNLIVNAVHAIQDATGEEPEKKGQIAISSRLVGDAVEVRIADSGTGIPEEIRNKIFDPFFTTKDVGRGTGQGLAIAYTVIVNKHNGTLEFESELGRGTTFIIRIPEKAYHD